MIAMTAFWVNINNEIHLKKNFLNNKKSFHKMIVNCLRQLRSPFVSISKDLLRECFSYLDNSNDIFHAGQVCKEWLSSIEHPVSWRGCTEINKKFTHSKYFKYLRVIDFSKSNIYDAISVNIKKNKWLEEIRNLKQTIVQKIFYYDEDNYDADDYEEDEYDRDIVFVHFPLMIYHMYFDFQSTAM